MAIGVTVAAAAAKLESFLKDTPTTLNLVLCNASTWSSPPTSAEIVASIIAEVNGYTFQDVTPTGSASTPTTTRAEIDLEDASISVTTGTINYDAYAVIRDGTLAVQYESFTSSRALTLATSPHTFTDLVAFETV